MPAIDPRPNWHPDCGTRWLHVWVDAIGNAEGVLVWCQYETAGITLGVPAVFVMPASAARNMIDSLMPCRPVRHGKLSLSISLDSQHGENKS